MRDGKKHRLLKAACLLAGVLSAGILLYALRPPCLILKTTHFYCAGCGTQRMLSALLQGDFSKAFRQNPFMFFLLPCAAGCLIAEAARYVQKKRPLYKGRFFPVALFTVLIASLLFTVLRNLPDFGFLRPL